MTRRSRSSFDLRDALGTAEALSPRPPAVEEPIVDLDGVPLVTFQAERGSRPPQAPAPPVAPVTISRPIGDLAAPPELAPGLGLVPRLDAAIAWLRRDPQVDRVIVVDGEGLPIAGDIAGADRLAAAAGGVVAAVRRVADASPGGLAQHFETCIGEQPVLQLVGVSIDRGAFVVGISRALPYAEHDVRLLRSTFAAALAQP
jgi:hypothetical protein